MEAVSRIDELRDLLQSADHAVRRRAAIDLGKIGDAAKAAVPMLIEALRDGNGDVRFYSAQALGQIGDVEATPALTELSNADPHDYIRVTAINALKNIDPLKSGGANQKVTHRKWWQFWKLQPGA